MREILFRGKCKDCGAWVEIYPFYETETETEIESAQNDCENCNKYDSRYIKSTLGQYTGLTDKNGVKVFEGDILDGSWATPQDPMRFAVKWYSIHGGFNIMGLNTLAFEVIGNIHDNPELLEGKE